MIGKLGLVLFIISGKVVTTKYLSFSNKTKRCIKNGFLKFIIMLNLSTKIIPVEDFIGLYQKNH